MLPPTLFNLLQQLLPQHLLTAVVHRATRCRTPWVKNAMIGGFRWVYGISLAEAERAHDTDYACFNDFFTRALKPGARPLDPDPAALLCPVDGKVSQVGVIERGQVLQAKGREYSVATLLGGDARTASRFEGGTFATLYLAPHNYHRIHMPCAGRLETMHYIPGRLYSVNEASVAGIEGLFARNERVVCTFDGPGRFVLCLVGALFVGSMETTWHGRVTPALRREPALYDYRGNRTPVVLERGAEMGRFNMGSTVILLFEPGCATWTPELKPGTAVQVGRKIGQLITKSDASSASGLPVITAKGIAPAPPEPSAS